MRYTVENRQISSNSHSPLTYEPLKSELDSHADTTVAGAICYVMEYTESSCDVFPFSEEYQPMKQVPIAKVATAYDHPRTGETYILIFGQALYLGDKLQHMLICPNQARHNGVIIDDIPRHLSHDNSSTHSIYFPDSDVRIPLQLKGIISNIDTRLPSQHEINNCKWLIMTVDNDWDPYDEAFAHHEELASEPYTDFSASPLPGDREIGGLMTNPTPSADSTTDIYRTVSTLSTSGRRLVTMDEAIAKTFYCSPKIATRTRKVTTQKGICSMTDHLCCRFRTKLAALHYNQLGGKHGVFYSDTMFSSVKSLHRYEMGQIFVNNINYTYFVPMKLKSEAGNALVQFIPEVGIPSQIHTDDAKELVKGKWRDVCQSYDIKQTQTEPYKPFQNRAEVGIRELKKTTQRIMHTTKTPLCLWDMCAKYKSELRSLTAQPLYSLHGRTPFEMVTGNTPYISEYIAFQWYQPVWYYDTTSFPEATKHMARWIGVAHNVGQAMCFWLLPISGVPIARSTVQGITEVELRNPEIIDALQKMDESIHNKLGAHDDDFPFELDRQGLVQELRDADDEGIYEPLEPEADRPKIDDYDEETYDRLISAEVVLPKGEYQHIARVIGRKRDQEGNPIGKYNKNPILDTTVYEVEFPDNTIRDYAANVLAEAMSHKSILMILVTYC